MQDRPNVDELLQAVAGFLQDEIVPGTTGRLSFHARVSANVLQMLRRELSLEEGHVEREWAGLDGILGPEERPAEMSATRARLTERNAALAAQIREGGADDPGLRATLLAHLRTVTRDKLEVSNPGLLAEG